MINQNNSFFGYIGEQVFQLTEQPDQIFLPREPKICLTN